MEKPAKQIHLLMTTERLIAKGLERFGNQITYEKTVYTKATEKSTFTCSIHGDFKQDPYTFLNGMVGCFKCGIELRRKNKIEKGKQKYEQAFRDTYKNRYQYDWSTYNGAAHPMRMICSTHGEFWQRPNCHLERGHGCSRCSDKERGLNKRIGKERALVLFKKEFKDKYDYSLVPEDMTYYTPIQIICKRENHGVFTTDLARHLHGVGCPKCAESKGERRIRNYLTKWGIPFESQKRFDGCVHKGQLTFDFYIPLINTAIEYQGQQHFRPCEKFGGIEAFESGKIRDQIKKDYCREHNICLKEITYREDIKTRLIEILDALYQA